MAYKELTAEQFKEQLEKSDNAVVIDVRTPEEKSDGDIPGSKLYNLLDPSFKENINKLDKDKEYFVFCKSGGRSGTACKYMANQGLKCNNLLGGIHAWNNKYKS